MARRWLPLEQHIKRLQRERKAFQTPRKPEKLFGGTWSLTVERDKDGKNLHVSMEKDLGSLQVGEATVHAAEQKAIGTSTHIKLAQYGSGASHEDTYYLQITSPETIDALLHYFANMKRPNIAVGVKIDPSLFESGSDTSGFLTPTIELKSCLKECGVDQATVGFFAKTTRVPEREAAKYLEAVRQEAALYSPPEKNGARSFQQRGLFDRPSESRPSSGPPPLQR